MFFCDLALMLISINIGQMMNVVVLRHTPAVAAHLENNETVYKGLEVEVSQCRT